MHALNRLFWFLMCGVLLCVWGCNSPAPQSADTAQHTNSTDLTHTNDPTESPPEPDPFAEPEPEPPLELQPPPDPPDNFVLPDDSEPKPPTPNTTQKISDDFLLPDNAEPPTDPAEPQPVLDDTLVIEGFVLDTKKAPIENADIEVCTANFCFAHISAGIDGRFVTMPLALDFYEVRVTAPGFALSSAQGVVPGGPPVLLALSEGGALTGRTTNADGSGVQATIHVGGAGLFPPRVVRADAQGQFTVWGLPAGSYEVLALAGDLGSRWPTIAKVENALTAGHVDIPMQPGYVLTLQIKGNAIAIGGGIAEATVEGALVTLAPDPLHVLALHDISDSRGEVRFTGLPAGRYHVGVRAPGYLSDTPRWVDVPSPAPIPIVMARGATVEGLVMNRDGLPISGAKLTAHVRTTSGAYWILDDDKTGVVHKLVRPDGTALTGGTKRFATNGQGRFAISGLPPGEVTVEASKAGFIPERTPTAALMEGDISAGHTLTLFPGIPVEGEVQSADGSPLSGAQVRWRKGADTGFWRATARSVGGGLFRFDAVTEDVVFEVLAPGYAPLLVPMQLNTAGGMAQRVVLRFEAGEGSVFGQVLGPDGAELVGADVSAWEPGSGAGHAGAAAKCRARTDSRGVFQLMHCGEGRRLVEVRGPSAAPAWAEVNTGKDLEVRLVVGGTLTAQLLGADGAPIPRARVKAVAQVGVQNGDAHTWQHEWLIQGGRWEQPYMPPGMYALTFSADGFGTASFEGVEVRDGEAVDLGEMGKIELAPLRRLEGFVMDYYRTPASGARVWVVGRGKEAATAGADGRFFLTLGEDNDGDSITLEAVHWQHGRGFLTLAYPLPVGAPEDVLLALNLGLEDGQEDWRSRLGDEGVSVSVDGKSRVVVTIQSGSVWVGAGLKEGDLIESLSPDDGLVESITVVRKSRRHTLRKPAP